MSINDIAMRAEQERIIREFFHKLKVLEGWPDEVAEHFANLLCEKLNLI
jgi:hypothetical protein